jgi:SAM-dependent methyltransferase
VNIDPDRELAELKEYLGEDFDMRRLERWEESVDEELARVGGDESALYRTSQMYLYNLTVFAMSATKEPYLRDLTDIVKPPARILDYGCGIGSDGLALLEAGSEVGFADFANPSVEYLRWRLKKRGFDAPIYDLDNDPPPPGWDGAYSFDVIEHVEDPFSFLGNLERLSNLVVVNFLEPLPNEVDIHSHALPIPRLVEHAARQKLRRYRVYHDRSHLVLYERGHTSRVLARLRIARGKRRG